MFAMCRQGTVWTNAHLFDQPSPAAPSGRGARIRVVVHSDRGQQWHDATVLRIFTGLRVQRCEQGLCTHLPQLGTSWASNPTALKEP